MRSPSSSGKDVDMAEVVGVPGTRVEVGGAYACSECGHRIELRVGETFPPAHHLEKPWMLMVANA